MLSSVDLEKTQDATFASEVDSLRYRDSWMQLQRGVASLISSLIGHSVYLSVGFSGM